MQKEDREEVRQILTDVLAGHMAKQDGQYTELNLKIDNLIRVSFNLMVPLHQSTQILHLMRLRQTILYIRLRNIVLILK